MPDLSPVVPDPLVEVGVPGSGSNLVVADAVVRSLAVKPDQPLNQTELDGTRIDRGGQPRLPFPGWRGRG